MWQRSRSSLSNSALGLIRKKYLQNVIPAIFFATTNVDCVWREYNTSNSTGTVHEHNDLTLHSSLAESKSTHAEYNNTLADINVNDAESSTYNNDESSNDDAEEFDELEAASQELHDLTEALAIYVQKLDPVRNQAVVEHCRIKHLDLLSPKKRECKQYERRQTIMSNRSNYYESAEEFNEASKHYIELFDKLLILLTSQVFERMMESAGKRFRDNRRDGINKFRGVLRKRSWKAFPHVWFKHAPFEVQQLRADIPVDTIANTRSFRDYDTINTLLRLSNAAHPYRNALQTQMEQLTAHYDSLCNP